MHFVDEINEQIENGEEESSDVKDENGGNSTVSSRRRRDEDSDEDDSDSDTMKNKDDGSDRGLSYVHKKPDGSNYVVPMCDPAGGMVPCNLVEFHLARNEKEFYERFAELVRYVQRHCNDYWKTHTEALLARLKNAINCVEVTQSYKCGAYAELVDSGRLKTIDYIIIININFQIIRILWRQEMCLSSRLSRKSADWVF